jgi:hypothetical protein
MLVSIIAVKLAKLGQQFNHVLLYRAVRGPSSFHEAIKGVS